MQTEIRLALTEALCIKQIAVAQISNQSVSAKIVASRANSSERVFFFLSPRRRSGERTEERGRPNSQRHWHLLSPALSSIRWRRGSVWLRLRRAVPYRRFPTCRAPGERKTLRMSKPWPIGNRRYSRLEICATTQLRCESVRRFIGSIRESFPGISCRRRGNLQCPRLENSSTVDPSPALGKVFPPHESKGRAGCPHPAAAVRCVQPARRRGEDTQPYPPRAVQGFKAQKSFWANSLPGGEGQGEGEREFQLNWFH